MSITLGNVFLPHGLILAPMAGVTDVTFRQICKKYGAEYTVSEMVSAKALCYEQLSKRKEFNTSSTAYLATVRQEEQPMAIQLLGNDPEFMSEAAKMIEACDYKGCTSKEPPVAIDINMGCPVRKITSNGEGSALMKEPELAAKIVSAVVKAVKLPVTVKIRAGWDKNNINAPKMAKMLEDAGASLICVHGRTRDQFYYPGVNINVIKETKEAVSVPVVANGDIYGVEDAVKMISETNCDGIMIGRGAMGNPWIFEKIIAALEKKEYIVPSFEEKLKVAVAHLHDMINAKGERAGIAEGKKHMAWYITGMKGAASARTEIMNSTSVSGIEEILQNLLDAQ